MDTKWFKDLIALEHTRSFSRGSEQRNITQSAFSRRIKALEDALGTSLVQRDSYPLELTESGKKLHAVAIEVVGRIEAVTEELSSDNRPAGRFLRIATQHSLATTYLPQFLHSLRDRANHLRSHVLSGNLTHCFDDFRSGACAMMICYTHPSFKLDLDPHEYETFQIGTDRLLPVAQQAAAQKGLWSIPTARCKRVPLLTYEEDSFLGVAINPLINHPKARFEIFHVDSYSESLKRLALDGAGVAWLPERLVHDELQEESLTLVGGPDWQIELAIAAVLPRSSDKPHLRTVRAFLCEQFGAPSTPDEARAALLKRR